MVQGGSTGTGEAAEDLACCNGEDLKARASSMRAKGAAAGLCSAARPAISSIGILRNRPAARGREAAVCRGGGRALRAAKAGPAAGPSSTGGASGTAPWIWGGTSREGRTSRLDQVPGGRSGGGAGGRSRGDHAGGRGDWAAGGIRGSPRMRRGDGKAGRPSARIFPQLEAQARPARTVAGGPHR